MNGDDDFRTRWRRWQLSRTSFNWWVAEALAGIVFIILGLIAGSTVLVVLGVAVALLSPAVIYRRWRGQRPPV